MPDAPPLRRRLALATGAALALALAVLPAGPARAAQLPLCGSSGRPTAPLRHVVVVMLENASYPAVVGPGSRTSFQSGELAARCGLLTSMYATTHTSAANYLATTAGQYPAHSPHGCGDVAACRSDGPSLFSQLEPGVGWRAYEESMGTDCRRTSGGAYKIGHNPALFYPGLDCRHRDLAVGDLTRPGNAFAEDLATDDLPGLSWVTPDLLHDGEHGLGRADAWLQAFLDQVQRSASWQAGGTAVLVTYDEGRGPDAAVDEDCTDRDADVAGRQPSCHVATFVVYPWASGRDATFFDHYSITRTVEDLFGVPRLAGAQGADSLLGHVGLPAA